MMEAAMASYRPGGQGQDAEGQDCPGSSATEAEVAAACVRAHPIHGGMSYTPFKDKVPVLTKSLALAIGEELVTQVRASY